MTAPIPTTIDAILDELAAKRTVSIVPDAEAQKAVEARQTMAGILADQAKVKTLRPARKSERFSERAA